MFNLETRLLTFRAICGRLSAELEGVDSAAASIC